MNSLLDQVNSLIKMQVGDPYRLEHIKSRLEENKILTLSDKKYLNDLLERYIGNIKRQEPQTSKIEPEITSEVNSETKYCWKCGNKNPNLAKFCNSCGSSIVEFAERPKEIPEIPKEIPEIPKEIPKKPTKDTQSWIQTRSTTMPKRMGKGKKFLVGVGIIAVVFVLGAVLGGDGFLTFFENIIDNLQTQIGSLLEGISLG